MKRNVFCETRIWIISDSSQENEQRDITFLIISLREISGTKNLSLD